MNRELIAAALGMILGFSIASAVFIDKLEKNDWTSDTFVRGCNNMYGNESWFIVKVNGKYSCMGNSTLVLPSTPVEWQDGR